MGSNYYVWEELGGVEGKRVASVVMCTFGKREHRAESFMGTLEVDLI